MKKKMPIRFLLFYSFLFSLLFSLVLIVRAETITPVYMKIIGSSNQYLSDEYPKPFNSSINTDNHDVHNIISLIRDYENRETMCIYTDTPYTAYGGWYYSTEGFQQKTMIQEDEDDYGDPCWEIDLFGDNGIFSTEQGESIQKLNFTLYYGEDENDFATCTTLNYTLIPYLSLKSLIPGTEMRDFQNITPGSELNASLNASANVADDITSFSFKVETPDDTNYKIASVTIDSGGSVKVKDNGLDITVSPNWKDDYNTDKTRQIKIKAGYKGLISYDQENQATGFDVDAIEYTLTITRLHQTEKPNITKQPASAEYWETDSEFEPLTISASAKVENLTYQWYYSNTEDKENWQKIEGATSNSYDFTEMANMVKSEVAEGKEKSEFSYTFWCEVTTPDAPEDDSQSIVSDPAKITIKADPRPTSIALKLVKKEADGATWEEISENELTLVKGSSNNAQYGLKAKVEFYRTDEYARKNLRDENAMTLRYYSGDISANTSDPGNGSELLSAHVSIPDKDALDGHIFENIPSSVVGVQSYRVQTFIYGFINGKNETKSLLSSYKDAVKITVISDIAEKPTITLQPKMVTRYKPGETNTKNLSVNAKSEDGGEISYQWQQKTTGDWQDIDGATERSYKPVTSSEKLTVYYRCVVTNTVGPNVTAEAISDEAQVIFGDSIWEGSGTAADPYKITDYNDLLMLQQSVNQENNTYKNVHFVLTGDITLETGWEPIGTFQPGMAGPGNGAYMWPFSGTFDGGNYTVTVAANGKPLFGYVREADIQNLKIYGEQINGTALVNEYSVDYGPDGRYASGDDPEYTVNIKNVTILKGTKTKLSGFVHGLASGINTVNITGCTVEEGVVIGYDNDQNHIGSFIGDLSGTISGCRSAATVYGGNYVGGLSGSKNQSMSKCSVQSSEFSGTVTATGTFVGGIFGGGYSANDAPNTPCVSINDCLVTGTVSGADMVGGIFGGEGVVQCWQNGIGRIQNNLFTGTVSANKSNNVGAIIGYMNGLNKYNEIENNFYREGCGVARGIGFVQYLDTSAASVSGNVGTVYNSSGPHNVAHASRENHNRTDDPLGADAGKLAASASAEALKDGTILALLNKGAVESIWKQGETHPILSDEALPVELILSGNYKTEYYIGDAFDTSGMVLTVAYSDGTSKGLTVRDVRFEGFDSSRQAVLHMIASYGTLKAEFDVRILKRAVEKPNGDKSDTIQVSIKVMGDKKHGAPTGNSDTHTLQKGGLTTWIANKTYTVDLNSTVWDVLKQALKDNGMSWRNPSGNYVEAITKDGVELGEFDNGNLSGWMYTLNGKHPMYGVSEQFLEDGDQIIFHYTDDYTLEEGSEALINGGSGAGGTVGTGSNAGSIILQPGTTVNDKGQNQASVSNKEIESAISSAKDNDAKTIVIQPNVKTDKPAISVELTLDGAKAIVKADMGLTVDTRKGGLVMDGSALKSITDQAKGKDLRFNLEVKDKAVETVKNDASKALEQAAASLQGSVEGLLANASVTEVTITSDGKEITTFGGHKLIVRLPVEKEETFTEGGNYKVVVVSANGEVETLTGKCVKYNAHLMVQVEVSHLSTFIVLNEKYNAAAETGFTDVAPDAWYREAVEYAVAHGLMNGTSKTTFSPETVTTRAMIVTILHRLEGEPEAGTGNFTDVESGKWYTDAIAWAAGHDIVQGYGSGKFGPDDTITREQMAAILYRYAAYKGYDVSAQADLSGYADAGSVSGWALDAMRWAVAKGLIGGTSSTTLSPSGSALRCQVATILMRFCEGIA